MHKRHQASDWELRAPRARDFVCKHPMVCDDVSWLLICVFVHSLFVLVFGLVLWIVDVQNSVFDVM